MCVRLCGWGGWVGVWRPIRRDCYRNCIWRYVFCSVDVWRWDRSSLHRWYLHLTIPAWRSIHIIIIFYSSMMLQLPTYRYFSTYILVPHVRTYVSADDSRTVNGRTGSVFLFFIPHPVRQYVVVVARYVHTYVRTQRDFHPTIIKAKDSNQNHRMRQPDRTNATRFQIKAQRWQ